MAEKSMKEKFAADELVLCINLRLARSVNITISISVTCPPEAPLWQADPSCPACHVPDLRLEFGERLWRDAPLAPVIRDADVRYTLHARV